MKIVIVGCGVGGYTVARRLKELSPGVEVVLFTRESLGYYYKPHLPDFIAGEIEKEKIEICPPAKFRKEGIDIQISTNIIDVDRENKKVITEKGKKISYDKLILALGAASAIPDIHGVGLKGVYSFRTFKDAMLLTFQMMNLKQAVVIGGGYLGLETAAAIKKVGAEVTIIEKKPQLLPRQLDLMAGKLLQNQIEKLGLNFITGVSIEKIMGTDRVSGLLFDNGKTVDCDMVVICTGVRPNIELAVRSGLETGVGIKVDDDLQTSDPDIFALGDVIEHKNKTYGIIPPILEQAKVISNNILNEKYIQYSGSQQNTHLKIKDIYVESAGDPNYDGNKSVHAKFWDKDKNIYFNLTGESGRFLGYIVVGEPKISKELFHLLNTDKPFKEAALLPFKVMD